MIPPTNTKYHHEHHPHTMMTDAFYTLIGAIDATVFFISTRQVKASPMARSPVVHTKPEQPQYEPEQLTERLDDETTPASAASRGSGRSGSTVADELRKLIDVKEALLQAEAALGSSLQPPPVQRIAAAKIVSRQGPNAGIVPSIGLIAGGLAWAKFDEVLSSQSGVFALAVKRLKENAPEWSAMDQRLTRLMEFFMDVSLAGGNPQGQPSTSWGSTFGSSASSSSSTSIGYVPP